MVEFINRTNRFCMVVRVRSRTFNRELQYVFLSFVDRFLQRLARVHVRRVVSGYVVLQDALFEDSVYICRDLRVA